MILRPIVTVILGSASLLAVRCPISAQDPGITRSEFIFETAAFPECHASTIAETPGGLICAWFGGTREKHKDVGIWISRSQGGTWSVPVEIATGVQTDGTRYPCWNPVLYQTAKGPLILFYKVGPSPDTWWGIRTESRDQGKTWEPSKRLPEGILGPIKNKPVLIDGELLSPSSSEHDGWRVHFERSPDLGITWRRTGPVNDGRPIGAIQPSILFHPNGRLQAIGRTQQKRLFSIESPDRGATWGEMKLTSLPNPNAGTDAITLADGRHLLVYNHTEKGRSPLNVAVSTDGDRWQAAAVLEREAGEFSYPAVIQSSGGTVHITYTWKRQRVRHAVVDPAKLQLRPITDSQWPQ